MLSLVTGFNQKEEASREGELRANESKCPLAPAGRPAACEMKRFDGRFGVCGGEKGGGGNGLGRNHSGVLIQRLEEMFEEEEEQQQVGTSGTSPLLSWVSDCPCVNRRQSGDVTSDTRSAAF